MFPEGSLPSKAEIQRFHGHYGNEIRMVDLSIRGVPARSFLEYLWKGLPSFDRASILDALDRYLDSGGGLHLRLDKEEVSRGILRLKDQDPIKIELSFKTRTKSDLGLNERVKQHLESLERSSANSTSHLSVKG